MPNCDFYATPEDHEDVLSWLFAEDSCDVYEHYSAFEQPLKRFRSAAEVLARFQRPPGEPPCQAVLLSLYVRGAGPAFVPRHIALNPQACGGAAFRYSASGWGMVQLHLHAPVIDKVRLDNSHTNHNTLLRAQTWSATFPEDGPVEAWDFARITSFSSRLNRQIRKRGVAKLRGYVLHPGALALWELGVAMGPFKPGIHALQKV
ncbi:hypothetical protein QFZ42_000103 [Variovorax paradoxus]|uniref:hypothetical protein n=1 Tax=Variovorax paradoxus TaxID=34073 RepID=UPI00278DCA33|nr:hypothetical protein [Variovorax paradoxus]MDQ0568269.1 hypothetical protein [Variovorax paradoxus]